MSLRVAILFAVVFLCLAVLVFAPIIAAEEDVYWQAIVGVLVVSVVVSTVVYLFTLLIGQWSTTVRERTGPFIAVSLAISLLLMPLLVLLFFALAVIGVHV